MCRVSLRGGRVTRKQAATGVTGRRERKTRSKGLIAGHAEARGKMEERGKPVDR